MEGLRPIKLAADVFRDLFVEPRLGVGKLEGNRVGNPLRKKWCAVELEKVLLDHPAHQVGDIRRMHTVAKSALETVAVEQSHEELKIRFLPVVGCGRHQKEVARQGRKELTQPIALGVSGLRSKDAGGHLVRLVANDEIPAAVRRLELFLDIFVPRQLVQARDDEIGLQEPVPGPGGLQLVVGEDLEGEVEAGR